MSSDGWKGRKLVGGDRASLPVYDPVGDFFRTGITAINSLIFTAGNSHVAKLFFVCQYDRTGHRS